MLGLRPKSSLVRYSYLSKLLENNADILAAFLSKSYCASFYIIFCLKLLADQLLSSLQEEKKIFLNFRELLAGNVVSIVKKEYGSLVHSM